MKQISKRDFLKTIPATLPIALLGSTATSALAQDTGEVTLQSAQLQRDDGTYEVFYIQCPIEYVDRNLEVEDERPLNHLETIPWMCQLIHRGIFGEDGSRNELQACETLVNGIIDSGQDVVETVYLLATMGPTTILKLGRTASVFIAYVLRKINAE